MVANPAIGLILPVPSDDRLHWFDLGLSMGMKAMEPGPVHRWLRRKTLIDAILSFPVAILAFLFSLPMLAIAFGMAYLASWFVFTDIRAAFYWLWSKETVFSSQLHLSIASTGLLLLFIITVQLTPEFLRDYPRIKWPLPQTASSRTIQVETMPWLRNFVSSFVLDLLLCGPRCALFGWATLRRACRLCCFDVATCSSILSLLLQRGRRVPFAELTNLAPQILSRRILVQMHDIEGVVFLTEDPLGLSLTSDLREELRNAGRTRNAQRPPEFESFRNAPSSSPSHQQHPLFPYYQALGLTPGASPAEVKAAYRKCLKNCHPDRFQDFGTDWGELAAQKTRELITAYETITAAESEEVEQDAVTSKY